MRYSTAGRMRSLRPLAVLGRRARREALATATACAAGVAVGCNSPHPGLVPHDALLRDAPVTLYPAADRTKPPRAIIFFFGNDVGFWQPHQALAWSLRGEQFAVAGFDMRRFLRALPEDAKARDSVAAARLWRYIEAARRELAGAPPSAAPRSAAPRSAAPLSAATEPTLAASPRSVPLILAGHSIGSEVALWAAAHLPLDHLDGVLAMSPGNRSHLAISASDLLMTSEPTGPGSFSVAEQVSALGARVRVAIVRGGRDKLADADPALLAAGGAMARRWVVPFSGHSLKSQLLGPHFVLDALDWLLAPGAGGSQAIPCAESAPRVDGRHPSP
ncbi:MAG: hypothetical protein U0164_15030 [Gemmatimonadaceae bacterium]